MDARTRYTKKMIQEVFLDLLEKKNIEKITVKEICDKAEINRATFYKYYDNAFDLLAKLETETMEKLKDEINSLPNLNFIGIFRLVLNKNLENRRLYELLYK
ncbi:MAG: TetR/AcrR family transcriptional regulator, partial [Lachnospiraceae bacterium]|nr:TetR/AcrR family transcriptional regulator [Lachnospiraceae bacterium]